MKTTKEEDSIVRRGFESSTGISNSSELERYIDDRNVFPGSLVDESERAENDREEFFAYL